MEERKTLAVVGCGASAVVFLRSFIQECKIKQINNINLTIFEPASILGTGLAYQMDLHNLILNRPANTMSSNIYKIDEYYQWMKKKLNYAKQENLIFPSDNYFYTSRSFFGGYLAEMLKKR
ncbi:FAD/NAD(P)-binding protein [Legionella septentrionalis]|uniref:FAD/NAD(P)-binding protein n=1 Tax=Legionella septentrionalis TaxID=2498109 RepID=UPI000F8CFF3F|nr:FAD/NAD(P)-binding protein [Legionella septentrionalis]RUQ99593.1 hypothetical protein ELY11_04545 [Legionella septentrionalis]